jgi:hypothetical protein
MFLKLRRWRSAPISLLYSQYYAESDDTLWEFWLLRFPFAVHVSLIANCLSDYFIHPD